MSEPKFKLGDDGELEEIFEDLDEKPKRKRKLKPLNRTLQIPLGLMLMLVASVSLLVIIAFGILRPAPILISPTASSTFLPTQTPFRWLGQLPLCSSVPLTKTARFVYQAGSDKGNEILRIDADGTNACRVTDNVDIEDVQPSFSPDGSKIVFARPDYRAKDSEIYVMDADGNNIKKLTNNFDATDLPNWSPDGKLIVFSARIKNGQDLEIYVMDSNGSNLVNVSNSPRNDYNPDWSPDGQSIVFVSDRTYPEKVKAGINRPDGTEIYVMSPNGENVRQLTFNDTSDLSPSWSPDGEQILFFSPSNLYLMDKEGNNRRQLTTNGNVNFVQPFWLPDGKKIGFTYLSNPAIQFMDLQSGQLSSLRVQGDPFSMSPWSPPA